MRLLIFINHVRLYTYNSPFCSSCFKKVTAMNMQFFLDIQHKAVVIHQPCVLAVTIVITFREYVAFKAIRWKHIYKLQYLLCLVLVCPTSDEWTIWICITFAVTSIRRHSLFTIGIKLTALAHYNVHGTLFGICEI